MTDEEGSLFDESEAEGVDDGADEEEEARQQRQQRVGVGKMVEPVVQQSPQPAATTQDGGAGGRRSRKSSTAASKAAKMAKMHGKVVQEIVDSEELYCKFLGILVDHYVKPMRKLVGEQETMNVFANVDGLLHFHSIMAQELQTCDGKVCSVLVKFAHFLKLYKPYVANYERSLTSLSSLRQRSEVESFLQKKATDPACGGLDLMSLMIMPIQRIPRYRLLLQSLKKYTPENDPEMGKLDTCLGMVSEVADQVNDSKAELERMSRVMEVQHRVSGYFDLMRPGRQLLRETPFIQKKKSSKSIHLFLFNDILLWTSPAPGYKYKGVLQLARAKLGHYEHATKIGFRIIAADVPNDLVLICKNDNQKAQWVGILNEAISTAVASRKELRSRTHKRRQDVTGKIQAKLEELQKLKQAAKDATPGGDGAE